MLTADRHETRETNVRIPVAWRKGLAAHGDAQGQRLSAVIRRALFEYIERHNVEV